MKQNLDDKMFGKVSKAAAKITIEDKKDKKQGLIADKINFFPNRDEIIKNKENLLKNNLRTDFKPRTLNSTSALNNYKKNFSENPQTTMDKIVILMKRVKDRLLIHNEIEAVADAEWITKEIVTHNIYKVKNEDKEQNIFFDEYSNIKSEKMFNKTIIKSENQIPIEPVTPLMRPNNELYNLKLHSFGPEFDIFSYAQKIERESVLFNVAKPIFTYKDINKFLKSSKIQDYINEIRIGYTMNENALYHSDLHAADVLQNTFYFCYNCQFDDVLGLEGVDILSLFYAALIHDFKHPGYTNMFMNNSSSDISYTYNDKSPLENYHVAEAFNLTKIKNLNIFEKMKSELFKVLRKRTIECVISTDMALHSKHMSQITSKIDYYSQSGEGTSFIEFYTDEKNNNLKFETQQDFMNFILHVADISHPAKPWEIELKWSDLIFKEFFNQGDREKSMNLSVSFLCDRDTVNIPQSQIGFINNIIGPTFELVKALLPNTDSLMNCIEENLNKWNQVDILETKKKNEMQKRQEIKIAIEEE